MWRSPGARPHLAARLLLALLVPALLLAACDRGTSGDGEASTPDLRAAAETDAPAVVTTPPPLHPDVDRLPSGTVLVDPGAGAADLPVAVRIASTHEARRFGLMEVPEVPDGTGMWFTYREDRTGPFWMRNTLVDLDIAWVDAAGRIVSTATMAVCDTSPCPRYEPGETYRHALEVPAGWLDANDVEVGDTVALVATAP